MKTAIIMISLAGKSASAGYLAGAIIAILILGLMIYVLVKPEKF
jgi:hypothetical protein